ncbi:carboxypeptidase Taq [Paenibacillus shirakamiensis]|uniref:Metal-dependent carboxypeptidase n=1 Tax=Paenibacillus shirakamiensis TaxID=1265935 RepID=A0ABS4JD25_9BACL|nr:carboxypeptidase M32 [Paenibacillus shirakamiensis]MBP1999623.1 carboxypeptidase Taq [Paenibacillus shirakamiensis]
MSISAESQTLEQQVQAFKALDEKIIHLGSILGLVEWDQKVMAPKKGRGLFAKAIGTLSTEAFKLTVSKEMGELVNQLSSPENSARLDDITRAQVRERKMEYDRSHLIPEDMYREYVVLTAEANDIWEEARNQADFSIFEPALVKIVEFKRKAAEIYGYQDHPYDALLDEFEPGLTVKVLDPLFARLRESSVDLLRRTQQSTSKPREDLFEQKYPIDVQKTFNREMLPIIGFDLDAGRLDETVHPFAQTINTGDVRITTRYVETNVRSALFGTIHEAGHGIYEQNIDASLEGTVLSTGASFGIHESQSRFLENMVGRSEAFWKYFYKGLQSAFPEQLGTVQLVDFYRAINRVQPSLIRVEADELTYNLHIMLRYEIEKALIGGDIEVKDLPAIWNQKVEDYLGIRPANDREGVLQDVHWSFGGFGYFPSYSLGNLYAAQILHTIEQQVPNLYEAIEQGDFDTVQTWLHAQIHQYGKLYTPEELILKVTGEPLNADYLVDYLEQKYSRIYNL